MTVFQLVGIVLFIFGTVSQHQAHVTLANLRKKGKKAYVNVGCDSLMLGLHFMFYSFFLGSKVITQRHQIPHGGLFELISCPNYFAEILIYSSFAFIFSFQNTCWNAVLFWVIANQVSWNCSSYLLLGLGS